MIQHIYLIILGYFLLGGLGFLLINRRKDASVRKQNWLKYASYFVIINVLFFSIVMQGPWFRMLSLIIILGGYFELWKVFRQAAYKKSALFSGAMAVFLVLALGFFAFGYLDRQVMLFTFLVLSVFDAFSQIFGQMLGRTKLIPGISPNKTLEGLLGGLLSPS
jgi:phosphatidate cytidylyltransferase